MSRDECAECGAMLGMSREARRRRLLANTSHRCVRCVGRDQAAMLQRMNALSMSLQTHDDSVAGEFIVTRRARVLVAPLETSAAWRAVRESFVGDERRAA